MKKIAKIIGILFLAIVLLIGSGVAYFFIRNRMFLESADPQFVDYLKNNQAVYQDGFDERLFDSAFYRSDVFLFGEIHGFADNQKMDEHFFTWLNKKVGLRYYVAEMDSIHAQKLNTYLSNPSKDDVLLKEIVNGVKARIPQQASQELYNKWNALYDYNKTLDDSAKIVILGVDLDFADTNSTLPRDSVMIMNFRRLVAEQNLQHEKFYGFFGMFHVLQADPSNLTRPFGMRLKQSGYKVSSISSYTLDSEMYLPKNPQFPAPPDEKVDLVNCDGPFMLVKGINDFRAASNANSSTLFKINAEGTPYSNSKKLISMKATLFGDSFVPSENQNTTDYFQYALLLRNSAALTPLK